MVALFQLTRDADKIAQSGLSVAAVAWIFRGSDSAITVPDFLSTPSEGLSNFIESEYRSCTVTYNCFDKEAFSVVDPWGGSVSITSVGCCPADHKQLPFDHLLLLYPFNLGLPNEFWLGSYSTYAKITHIIFPQMQTVIFAYDETLAQSVTDVFLKSYDSMTKNLRNSAEDLRRPKVGILDMVQNFAHQAMNYLSGIQRMIDLNMQDAFSEIWISGKEFFGPSEKVFTEIAGKVKRFEQYEEMTELLHTGGFLPYRLGSNIFLRSVQQRILSAAEQKLTWRRSTNRAPLIAVSVRQHGRRCVNLVEFIGFVADRLLEVWPNLGIVLDGWALPESDVVSASDVVTAFSSPFSGIIRAECMLALEVTQRLPKGLVVGNSVGQSMLNSIIGLTGVHGYIAHIGTPQHKLGFFTAAPGIVHGPENQLSWVETGAFQSETGRTPIFLPASAVEDVPADKPRGPRFYDYRIVNFDVAVDLLVGLLPQFS